MCELIDLIKSNKQKWFRVGLYHKNCDDTPHINVEFARFACKGDAWLYAKQIQERFSRLNKSTMPDAIVIC